MACGVIIFGFNPLPAVKPGDTKVSDEADRIREKFQSTPGG